MIVAPAMAALSVLLGAPESSRQISADALARLDPTRIAGSICGGKARGERARRAWLASARMAAATATRAQAPPRLLDGLADPGIRISTGKAPVHSYFNQGLMLTYGFNHEGAIAA